MEVSVEKFGGFLENARFEIVERKGLGHPDSIMDGMVEHLSKELCKRYVSEYGKIMHHNVDKGQLCGGKTEVEFGGGRFVKPIFILLSGRALPVGEENIGDFASRCSKEYLKRTIRNLDPETEVEFMSKISEGSKDLVDVFLREGMPKSNDTSFGVGYYPFSELESTVIRIEETLNSYETKKSHPYIGEDIKVMGVRNQNKSSITISAAMVSRHIMSLEEYWEAKEKAGEIVENILKEGNLDFSFAINTADEGESVFLTLSGTSAEMGDDGAVGRGNRVNGMITPYRPMSLEAAAGKNPVNHVGKIYNILANRIAKAVVEECGAEECYVYLVSQIGKEISEARAMLKVKTESGRVETEAKRTAETALENIQEITNLLAEGKVRVF